MSLPPKTCPECGGELRWVDGDLACTQLTKREIRADQLERCLRATDVRLLHDLYRVLPWTRGEVFTALHDLRARRVVSLGPAGSSDVRIRLLDGEEPRRAA